MRPFRADGFTVQVPESWDAQPIGRSRYVIAPRGKSLVASGSLSIERGIFAYSYSLGGDTGTRSLSDVTTALAPRFVRPGDSAVGQPKLVELDGRTWGLFIIKQPPSGGDPKSSIVFHFVQMNEAVVTVLAAGTYGDSPMEAAAAIEAEPHRAFDRIISSLRIDQAGPWPVALNLAARRPAPTGVAGTFSGPHGPEVSAFVNALKAAEDAVRYAPYGRP
jgi:hypothetical protein